MQPVGGRQASLKPAPKKVLEKPVYESIGSPFSPLDRLWRTLGQSRDFLCQPFVPQTPSEAAGDQTGNFGCSAAELALNCYGVNHCVCHLYLSPPRHLRPLLDHFSSRKMQEQT